MKIILIFIVFVLNSMCFAVNSDFTYTLDLNNYATITSYKGSSSVITIPSTIDGYNVKNIANHAFNESRTSTNGKILTKVIISEGITTVGDFAFVGCTNLESVILPETLTSLGDQTFIGCGKLKTINIPSNLKQLRNYVFQETGFTEFVIPEHFEVIGNCTFRICNKLKKVKVYSKNVVYNDNVFEHCSNDLVLYGYEGSTTQAYAQQNGLKFQLLSNQNETVPITSITLNKTAMSLTVGESQTLVVSVLPDNATDKTLNWSSSNTSVATVTNGKVTAKTEGDTVITVITKDGTKKAVCAINVKSQIMNYEISENNDNFNINYSYAVFSILLILIIIMCIICIMIRKNN